MQRREFFALLGGAAAIWPLAARAQQLRVRRIGVLMWLAEGDSEGQARIGAFRKTLQALGWMEGRNIQVELLPCCHSALMPAALMMGHHWQGIKDIEFLANPAAGEVRIGCPESLAPVASDIIDRLSRRHPGVVVHAVTTQPATLEFRETTTAVV